MRILEVVDIPMQRQSHWNVVINYLMLAPGHKHKPLSSSGIDAPGLRCVGLVACRFYLLKASPRGSSLERFPTLYIYIYIVCTSPSKGVIID